MIHSEIIQKANRAAMERWVSGTDDDSVQMLLSVRAALDVALPALREQILLEATRWLARFEADRSTPYREGKADGATAIVGVITRVFADG